MTWVLKSNETSHVLIQSFIVLQSFVSYCNHQWLHVIAMIAVNYSLFVREHDLVSFDFNTEFGHNIYALKEMNIIIIQKFINV